MTDTQPSKNTSEHEKRQTAESAWFFFFVLGCIALVSQIYGFRHDDAGDAFGVVVSVFIPVFIGFPAALISVVLTLWFRLSCLKIRFSVTLLSSLVLLIILCWVCGVLGIFR